MSRYAPRPRARRLLGAAATVAALATAAFGLSGTGTQTPSVAASGPGADAVSTTWTNPSLLVPNQSTLDGRITVAPGAKSVLTVTLKNATFVTLPRQCVKSSTINRRSHISADGTHLECWLTAREETRRISIRTLVDGTRSDFVRAKVAWPNGGGASFPSRLITEDQSRGARQLRLLSSPDFLNADVADLERGSNSWRAAKVRNGTNAEYESALAGVLDDWRSAAPDAVLVAGDMVNGHWGVDEADAGVFGPTKTPAQRRRAVTRAADTYFPQWLERFSDRGLSVFTAMGDHEFGDDPFRGPKRGLASTFEESYAKHFTRTPDGQPRFADRPRGKHEFSAYAGRPHPDVLVVTLNVFDTTAERTLIRVDDEQMEWLRGVLAKAQRDNVKWIVVQGHTPILWPVRMRGSSGLHYEGGRNSELWQVFRRYGVDLYLSGEVHDITATEADGITQVAHGGAFQFGLTNYLLLDFYDDFIYLTARDYDASFRTGLEHDRLWETELPGGPAHLEVDPEPVTVGTGRLLPDGDLVDESGLLRPWDGGYN